MASVVLPIAATENINVYYAFKFDYVVKFPSNSKIYNRPSASVARRRFNALP